MDLLFGLVLMLVFCELIGLFCLSVAWCYFDLGYIWCLNSLEV